MYFIYKGKYPFFEKYRVNQVWILVIFLEIMAVGTGLLEVD